MSEGDGPAKPCPVPRPVLELEEPEPAPCPHCLLLALCPASPPAALLSPHARHTKPPREPVQGLALRVPAVGLPPPLAVPQPTLATAARCQHSSPGHGGPTPAPATGGRDPQAPTYPCPEQSEARVVDAGTRRQQPFYAGVASVGRSWPCWGHVAHGAKPLHPPRVARGCCADAVSWPAPTRSISPCNHPTRTLASCHLMPPISPTVFSLSRCVRGHAA